MLHDYVQEQIRKTTFKELSDKQFENFILAGRSSIAPEQFQQVLDPTGDTNKESLTEIQDYANQKPLREDGEDKPEE